MTKAREKTAVASWTTRTSVNGLEIPFTWQRDFTSATIQNKTLTTRNSKTYKIQNWSAMQQSVSWERETWLWSSSTRFVNSGKLSGKPSGTLTRTTILISRRKNYNFSWSTGDFLSPASKLTKFSITLTRTRTVLSHTKISWCQLDTRSTRLRGFTSAKIASKTSDRQFAHTKGAGRLARALSRTV